MSDEHLTHGWEPDLDPGDSLLRSFVFSTAERGEFMARSVAGREERWDAAAVADPGSPVLFDNAAVLLQPPAYSDLEATVRRILDFYPPERHFVLLSAWPTPDLTASGLSLMGHPPLMLRPAGGAPPPLPDGLEVRRVTDRVTLDDFVTTIVDAYPIPGADGSALSNTAIVNGPIALFVGYLDGRPVATSGAHVGCGLNDVEWVSTVPSCRGRGIGAALTWAATLVDPSLPAALIASDDGQRVYEAMGYVRIQRLTMWYRSPR